MEKILKLLNENKLAKFLIKISPLPDDKTLHAFYGTVIYLVSLFFVPSLYALAIVSTAAILKEMYDEFNKDNHTPDVMDIIATVFIPLIITMFGVINGF
jgi:hypothetical protein